MTHGPESLSGDQITRLWTAGKPLQTPRKRERQEDQEHKRQYTAKERTPRLHRTFKKDSLTERAESLFDHWYAIATAYSSTELTFAAKDHLRAISGIAM